MTLLGFRLETELKDELENSYENDLKFADSMKSFEELLKERRYDVVVIDETSLQQENLIKLIERITTIQKKAIIIVIGETSNLKLVVGVIKAGAYDYLLKPISSKEVNDILEKAVKDNKLLAEKVNKNKNTGEKLIGQTKEIVEVYKTIGRVSNSIIPVLVIGEKGTGKTSVATAIHQFSERNSEKFISINCTSFQNELLERKLFGYEKNAFEGAISSQIGELEKANGGTLHLGNIESLSLDMQSKILYLLQEKEFFRIGGIEPIKINVRVIASTSEQLEALITKKVFIDELYNKLKVLEVNIPPLRDRKDDIPFIIEHYISDCNLELNKEVRGVSKPAMKKIMRYDWPGNINELKNAIKSSVALCKGSSILIDELPGDVTGNKIYKKLGTNQTWALTDWVAGEFLSLKENKQNNYYGIIVSKVEKELIRQVLELTNGKKVEAAEILGITRNTLRTKMNNYSLE